MRFLVDNQLPSALANWLRERGHEAEHVLDVGLAQGKDTPVWRFAQERKTVLITKESKCVEHIAKPLGHPLATSGLAHKSIRRQDDAITGPQWVLSMAI